VLFFGTSGCLQLTYFCYFCLVSCTIAMLKGYGRFLEQPRERLDMALILGYANLRPDNQGA
jgi:hypothetical protein